MSDVDKATLSADLRTQYTIEYLTKLLSGVIDGSIVVMGVETGGDIVAISPTLYGLNLYEQFITTHFIKAGNDAATANNPG